MNFNSLSGQLGSFYSEDPSNEIKNGMYIKSKIIIYSEHAHICKCMLYLLYTLKF
jgi:hypothetical protein